MAPIRVGIIGLSSATTNVSASPGDGWAASAHLPYLLASPHYTITALCNSSQESARLAVTRHNLPPSTKTYGNPEDLAADPDVDLVVINVRVDRHHALAMPALRAGKDVFVEWPVASNRALAEEMLETARRSGSKTVVGLQGRCSPFILKIKDMVEGGVVGDLLSSTVSFEFGFPGDAEPPATDYMAKKSVGGSLLTILFGHAADPVFFALGGLVDVDARLATRWKETKLLTAEGKFDRMLVRETPDHIMMHGTLGNNGAPMSVAMRSGKAFKDTPSFTWRVFGSKGEIRVTSMTPLSLALGGEKIEVFDHEKDAVEVVEVEYDEKVKDLPSFAKNIGRLYELFVEGGQVEKGFVDFEQAVQFHRLLEKMEKSSEEGKREKVAV